MNLEKEINELKARNKAVDANKNWETSWTRRGLLMAFTYLAIWLYLSAIGIGDAWLQQ